MGCGRCSWVLVVGGRGLMVAVGAEDGSGGSFVGGWHPHCLCSFGGGGAGTWASLGWYVVVVIRLFATSVATTWHLGLSSEGEGGVESNVGLFTHLRPKTARR